MTAFLSSPVFGITLTLVIYKAAGILHRRTGMIIFMPVIVTIVSIILLLKLFDIPYADFENGGKMIHFMLGPAVVALAVPLYQLRKEILKRKLPILLGILAGSVTSILSTTLIGRVLGGSREVVVSMVPKSVTTPIAIGIVEKIGGIVPLTAVLVVITGCIGALCGPEFCRLIGIRNKAAIGLAVGTATHGIGTARMMADDRFAGAISGLAIGLNGLATTIIVPLIRPFLI